MLGGQLASNIGDSVYAIALPWYVLAVHGGALLLGTVLAVYGVSRAALLLVGGQLSDRWRPWNAMLLADIARGAAITALAIVAAHGRASVATLIPLAIVLGAGSGIFIPSSNSVVPALVPDDDLQAANALTSGGEQLALLAGPAAGGVLVAAVGATSGFGVDAVSFALSAFSLARIRMLRRRPVRHDEADDDVMTDGPSLMAMLRSERALQVILVIGVAGNLGIGGMSEVSLPALVRGPLSSGAATYGALSAAFGAGALVGALVAAGTKPPCRPAILGSALFLVESAFLAVVPWLHDVVLVGAALVVFGLTNAWGNILTITAFQRWAPPAMLGRLMSLLFLAAFGSFPLSVLLGGVVVRDFGSSPFFVIAGAATATAVAGGLTQRAWREFGRTTTDDAALPATADL